MDEEKFLNDNLIIKKNKNNQIYTIEFKYTSFSLINSIIKTRIISGASTDEYYKSIIFKAESVKTFNEYQEDKKITRGKPNLLIPETAKMIRTLSKQLKYLIEKESKTIIGYHPNDIIVINDETFIFLGSELISKINSEETGMATISCPFSNSDFFVSPELLKVKTIPSLFHFKSCYFSFGCLIIFSLLGDDEFYKDYLNHQNPKKILDVLNNHHIKNTRIYWLLSRCLIEDPEERSIILI
jgi:hypothetical protein